MFTWYCLHRPESPILKHSNVHLHICCIVAFRPSNSNLHQLCLEWFMQRRNISWKDDFGGVVRRLMTKIFNLFHGTLCSSICFRATLWCISEKSANSCQTMQNLWFTSGFYWVRWLLYADPWFQKWFPLVKSSSKSGLFRKSESPKMLNWYSHCELISCLMLSKLQCLDNFSN